MPRIEQRGDRGVVIGEHHTQRGDADVLGIPVLIVLFEHELGVRHGDWLVGTIDGVGNRCTPVLYVQHRRVDDGKGVMAEKPREISDRSQ